MRKVICLLVLATSLFACTKPGNNAISPNPTDGPDDPLPPSSSAPGFGHSKSRPEGTPVSFPAGITVVGKPGFDEDCYSEARTQKKIKGSGNAVGFCITFRNTNAYPVRVELLPGIIWVAETNAITQDTSQNGLIVKTVSVLVPAHAVERTWLLAYCINADRSVTHTGDTFNAQPILSNHPGVKALVKQLATKKINAEEYTPEATQAEQAQLAVVGMAVVDIQYYGQVQPSTQPYLDQLPDSK